MTEANWADRYGDVMMGTFGVPLAELVRGEGCWVWDSHGKRYLDFLAGIAVNALGYAHPALVSAATRQANTLVHVSNFFATPPQLALAERLQNLTGAGQSGRVFFCNSGTEALEAAFKLARLAGRGGARSRIISLQGSFHGRTMGALALTGKSAMREPFEPMVPGVTHIEPTLEALDENLDETVAALLIEPIQGEAGVVDLPDGYLAMARKLTRERGALLIVDEVQTGVGRTGEWFAYQRHAVEPDAVTLAKGLGGGFPIGALVTFGDASALFQKGHHGSTFGGNAFATAVAGAVIDEIEKSHLLDNARSRGAELRKILAELGSPLIAGTRGEGLMIGIALTRPIAPALQGAAMREGLIVNAPNESTIRLTPPLIIGDEEVREFTQRFRSALALCDGDGSGVQLKRDDS